jgi:hypothetical protein
VNSAEVGSFMTSFCEHVTEFIKKNPTNMQQCIKILLFHICMKLSTLVEAQHVGGRCQAHTVPDNAHQLHVQQHSTYENQRLSVQF